MRSLGFVAAAALSSPRRSLKPRAVAARPVERLSEGAILATMAAGVGGLFAALVMTRHLPGPPCLVLREIVAGGTAAALAEIVLYPIEVFKVKRQTKKPIGDWVDLLKRRPGAAAGVARALLYHGLRLGLFPAVKRVLPGGDGLASKLLVGAACGAAGSVTCNPLDLAKTRLQHDPDRYANSLHALAAIPPQTLWVGAPASVARAASGSAGQLAAYDVVKQANLQSGRPAELAVLVASLASSVAYVTCAAPMDVVKARLMVAPDDKTRSTVFGCLVDIWRREGPFAIFAGWLPALLRLLPTTLLVFPLLEKFRLILGAGAF